MVTSVALCTLVEIACSEGSMLGLGGGVVILETLVHRWLAGMEDIHASGLSAINEVCNYIIQWGMSCFGTSDFHDVPVVWIVCATPCSPCSVNVCYITVGTFTRCGLSHH